jgi:hypothetical protein
MKTPGAAGSPVQIESGQHLLMANLLVANLLMWRSREGRRTRYCPQDGYRGKYSEQGHNDFSCCDPRT